MNTTRHTNITSNIPSSGPATSFRGLRLAIGLMSGTSLDGMDVAVIRSDGEKSVQFGPAATFAYDDDFRERLRSVLGVEGLKNPELKAVEDELTRLHIQAVIQFMDMYDLSTDEVDIIGFHGHTIFHDPKAKITHQIGNAQMLADATGISVVADFRSNDVAAGGQGAPLVPIYHRALAKGMMSGMAELSLPVCVLNLGGIANVTWVGAKNEKSEDDLLAFDTGPCNALLDDWVFKKTGNMFDDNGALASSGKANDDIIANMLSHPYFSAPNPKSLDRLDFNTDAVKDLSPEDGAATLVGFIAATVKKAQSTFPQQPANWVLSGGGCHNGALVDALKGALTGEVKTADEIGWSGDAMEAQAFAYLALRSIAGLPITFPRTTGVAAPLGGGKQFKPLLPRLPC